MELLADRGTELSRFQCIDLTVEPSTTGNSVGITARLVEVTLKGAPVNAPMGSASALADAKWMRNVEAIFVGDLRGRDVDTMKVSA